MLVRLVYASRAKKAPTAEDIEAIVAQARAHNPAQGLTGILCWAGDVFLQAIEGGREPVNRLFRQIAADPRHADLHLIAYDEVSERGFGCWTMGQVNLAKVNPTLILKHCERPTLDPATLTAAGALALLTELSATAAVSAGRP